MIQRKQTHKVKTSNEDVIDTDGNITVPDADTAVDVTFRVTRAADGATADRMITVMVPAEETVADRILECDDPAVTYSTEIATATSGVRNQWFYSANSSDQGGKSMAYNYQGGDAPSFEVTFEGEKIVMLSRSQNDQSDIAVTIRDADENVVAEGTAQCYINSSTGQYQVHVYESPELEPGTYTLTGVSQPTRNGEYTVVGGFIVSGRTGEGADVDRTALNDKIEEAASAYIDSGRVDQLAYEYKRQFMDAYNNMLLARDNSAASQEEVDQAVAAMDEVIARLTDKTSLAETFDAAREKLDLLDRGDYEPDAVEAVENAMEEAQKVLDDQNAFLPDIQTALKKLSDALTALDGAKKDWTTLESLVEDGTNTVIPAIEAGEYESGDTADAYIAAYEQAKAVLEDESARASATQEEIDGLAKALSDARAALKPVENPDPEEPVSKKTLEYFLNRAKEHLENGDVDNCVESVRKLFEEAVAGGDAVMADGDAMQDDADAAWDALVTAMDNLRLRADKEALQNLLDSLGTLDLSLYTEESVQVYTAALVKANEVLADTSLSVDDQDEVDAAVKALADAKEQLALKETAGKDNGEGSGTDGQDLGSENRGADKAAKTGDTAPVAAAGVMILLSAAVLAIVRKRVKR